MSLNEAISQGLMVTGVGLLIVFGVLALLMLALMAMKALFYKEPESLKKKETDVKPVVEAVQPVAMQKSANDDSELIAVLTAAVAASLNTKTSGICIKSFRRVGSNAPLWNRAGVNEMVNSRL